MARSGTAHRDAVAAIAAALDLPEWLVESVALEYLPCRRFVTDGHHVVYDFALVTAAQVAALPKPWVVLNNVALYHNATQSVFTQRMLRGLVGSPLAAIPDRRLILPEGRVSPACGAIAWNDITAWDVKTGLDARAVVLDGDGLWQWEVREEDQADYPELGRQWYRSAVFSRGSMIELARAHDAVQGLLAEPYPAAAPEAEALRGRFEAAFARLEGVRTHMRAEALAHHRAKKAEPDAAYGYSTDPPLAVTVFDEPALRDGVLKVRSHIEPLLYRSAFRAAGRAALYRGRAADPRESAFWMTEETGAAAEAVILAVMCLEAYINGAIRDALPGFWKDMERAELRAKWMLVPHLLGHPDCFDRGGQPFQRFNTLVGWRNELAHYKHSYVAPFPHPDFGRVSGLYEMCNAGTARTAVETTAAMVRRLCDRRGVPAPAWLDNAGGWLDPVAVPAGPDQP